MGELDDQQFRGVGLVAFLDLLGFSKRIQNDWGRDSDPLATFLEMKEQFRRYRKSIKVEFYAEPGGPAPPDIKLARKVHTMSDSMMIGIGLPTVQVGENTGIQPEAIFKATMEMALTVREFCRIAADGGFAVRGGVEAGPIFWDADDFVGPTWNKAYLLESKYAKSARVIYGPEATGYVSHLFSNGWFEHNETEFYRIADDKLLCLKPLGIAPERLTALRGQAPVGDRDKYDEALKLQDGDHNVTVDGLTVARETVRGLLAKHGW